MVVSSIRLWCVFNISLVSLFSAIFNYFFVLTCISIQGALSKNHNFLQCITVLTGILHSTSPLLLWLQVTIKLPKVTTWTALLPSLQTGGVYWVPEQPFRTSNFSHNSTPSFWHQWIPQLEKAFWKLKKKQEKLTWKRGVCIQAQHTTNVANSNFAGN